MTTMRDGFSLPLPTPSSAPMPSSSMAGHVEDFNLDADLAEGLRAIGKFFRIEHVGRLVDKVAGEARCPSANPRGRHKCGACASRIGRCGS